MISKRIGVTHRRIIHRSDDVALLNACSFRSAATAHRIDDHAFRFRHAETCRQVTGHATNDDPELATPNFAVLHQLIHDALRHVRWNREAYADVRPTVAGNDLRVDADQFAHCVDERAARIAMIDWRISL